jgi:hypothetical protein
MGAQLAVMVPWIRKKARVAVIAARAAACESRDASGAESMRVGSAVNTHNRT